MSHEAKNTLIEEIQKLISVDGVEKITINPNYLEYFEIEELEEIKEQLLYKKQKIGETTKNYVEEIYEKFS